MSICSSSIRSFKVYQGILSLLAETLSPPRLFKPFSCSVSRKVNFLSKFGTFTLVCFICFGFHSISSIKKGGIIFCDFWWYSRKGGANPR